MKKVLLVLSLACSILAAPLFAQAKQAPAAAGTETAVSQGKGNLALLFNLKDLMTPLSPYSDGFQSGAGAKYWILDGLAARGLLSLEIAPGQNEATGTTSVGVSAAGEWHPRPGSISPYAGGLAGLAMLFANAGPELDFCFGAIGGVEFELYRNIRLFAEYQALFKRTLEGFGFDFGNSAVLGLAVYF